VLSAALLLFLCFFLNVKRCKEIQREMQRDAERCREMQRDAERCREMQRDAERCREMQRDADCPAVSFGMAPTLTDSDRL